MVGAGCLRAAFPAGGRAEDRRGRSHVAADCKGSKPLTLLPHTKTSKLQKSAYLYSNQSDLIICFGKEPYKCAFFSFFMLHPCYLYDRMPDLAGRRLRQ